ncbi:hypothetical protein E1171_00830, partial [Cytophagales bacterium RKSG123]|nr:hypothetical protein [Xanthovirga aplysinae]
MKSFTFYSNSGWRYIPTIETSKYNYQKKKREKKPFIQRRANKPYSNFFLIFLLAFFGSIKMAFGQQVIDNLFQGPLAGSSNTTGRVNSFFGYYAGTSNTSGSYNSYFGWGAGGANTTGYANTFIGYGSGYDNKAGGANTFIGMNAGRKSTGSSNVFIGYSAGYDETGSNKLYITNTDTSSPLIYGDFAANTLTFNGNTTTNGNSTTTGTLSFGSANTTSGALSFGSKTRQVINLWNTNYGIGIQGSTQYYRTDSHFAWFKGGSHSDATFNPGSGGSVMMVLNDSGNLGIGKTSPTAKLDVAGKIKADGVVLSIGSFPDYVFEKEY